MREALSQCLVRTDENPWGDPGTAGQKPEYSCPFWSPAKLCLKYMVSGMSCQLSATSVSWDPEGSFSPPPPTRLTGSSKQTLHSLRAGDLQPQILINPNPGTGKTGQE